MCREPSAVYSGATADAGSGWEGRKREIDMAARIDYTRVGQDAYKAMLGLEAYLAKCGLDHKLIHTLKLRGSQINGCAFCIDMHWKDAKAAGETEQRLYGLDAWEESPYYTDRERAALA